MFSESVDSFWIRSPFSASTYWRKC